MAAKVALVGAASLSRSVDFEEHESASTILLVPTGKLVRFSALIALSIVLVGPFNGIPGSTGWSASLPSVHLSTAKPAGT